MRVSAPLYRAISLMVQHSRLCCGALPRGDVSLPVRFQLIDRVVNFLADLKRALFFGRKLLEPRRQRATQAAARGLVSDRDTFERDREADDLAHAAKDREQQNARG